MSEDRSYAALPYELRASAAGLFLQDKSPPPSLVSHYTDAAGLIGILGRREIWATNAYFMNDTSEMRWGCELFQEHVPVWIEQAVSDIPGEVSSVKKTLTRGISEAFEKSFSGVTENVYAVCFCLEGDLLSQWRGYGSFGGGYSIQFSAPELNELVGQVPRFRFVKVLYGDEETCAAGRKVVRHVIATIRAARQEGETVGDIIQTAAQAISGGLSHLTSRVKNPAFEQEHEWRLIYSDGARGFNTVPLPRRFRAMDRGVTPYVTIRTDEPAKALEFANVRLSLSSSVSLPTLPVVSVTLGPTADAVTSERSVRYLLDDGGFDDVPVIRSAIPLRG